MNLLYISNSKYKDKIEKLYLSTFQKEISNTFNVGVANLKENYRLD